MPESVYFNNYLDYQTWKLSNSVELPIYVVEKGRKNHMLDLEKIRIMDDEEFIYVVREGFYSFEKGVAFKLENSML